MTDELNIYTNKSITLLQSLNNWEEYLAGSIALLYSPQTCILARFDNNELKTLNNQEESINLANYTEQYIFEARIFNKKCELRWLNENNGIGCSAILFDNLDGDIESSVNKNSSQLKYIERLEQQYLLWGEKTQDSPDKSAKLDNWQLLSSARIGTISVPLKQELLKHQRVYLKTFEYLREIDNHGNIAIVEERLIQLEVK